MLAFFYSYSVFAQLSGTVLFTVYGKNENIRVATDAAYIALKHKIISRIPGAYDLSVEKFIIPRHVIKLSYLGRNTERSMSKVMLRMTDENYYDILQKLETIIENKLRPENTIWGSEAVETMLTELNSLKLLLRLEVSEDLKTWQLIHQKKYEKIQSKVEERLLKSKIKFVGELEGAKVLLDGIPRSAFEFSRLLPGKHVFAIHKRGYVTIHGSLYLNPGETRELFISLLKRPKKFLKVALKLSPSLKEYESHIVSVLKDLGLTISDEAVDLLLEMNLESSLVNIYTGGMNTQKITYLINAEVLSDNDVVTEKRMFNEKWRQAYNSVGEETIRKNSAHLKDILSRALYNLRQNMYKINYN